MKVLQVNKFFYLKGGSEAYLFSLIDGLRGRGHLTAEFAMSSPANRPSRWSRYFVSEIDYDTTKLREKIRAAAKIVYSLEARRKIALLLDAFEPDLVHLHIFQHQLSPSIIPEIVRRGIPVVYTAHDLKSVCPNYKMLTGGEVCERCRRLRFYNCLLFRCVKESYLKSAVNMVEMYAHVLRRYYSLIDLVVTPSSFYRSKLTSYRFPEEKVVHIPNFVEEGSFSPCYENDGYFIYLGRLSGEKGIFTLLKAMKRVEAGGRLVIVGTGPLRSAIEEEIERENLRNVRLAGFQSGKKLRDLVARSMFTVIPSEWYENGPISLMESFASGKPVVGSGIGGIPEHISDGVDGLTFTPGDQEDLAGKINFLLARPSLLHTMGRAARRKAETSFSRDVHLERIEAVYRRLCS